MYVSMEWWITVQTFKKPTNMLKKLFLSFFSYKHSWTTSVLKRDGSMRGNQQRLISYVDALPLFRLRSDSCALILCKTAGKTFPLSGVFLHGCATLATLAKGADNFICPIWIADPNKSCFQSVNVFQKLLWSFSADSPFFPVYGVVKLSTPPPPNISAACRAGWY